MEAIEPVDFIGLFLTDDLLQYVCEQTNLYGRQYIATADKTQTNSRVWDWIPVTVSEIKRLLGLFFLTGIVRLPKIEMHWSTDEVVGTPYFNKTMARNRFQLIMKFFHTCSNIDYDADDRLYKIRPILDYLTAKFKANFTPGQKISIDEGMLLWRGRLKFRCFSPLKPVKYGLKSYILADSNTGYCYSIKPYDGKYEGKPKTSLRKTVDFLLDDLKGCGYKLYMDNYYNSIKMCKHLLRLKTHVCGTLRKHRGEPKAIKHLTLKNLKVGQTVMRHNGRAMVLAWRDKEL